MNTGVMFSKASDEWSTPQDLFSELNLEFEFIWDLAASKDNSKCGSYYYGPDHVDLNRRDALACRWVGSVVPGALWLNPPYSQCREFIEKAAASAKAGATVVCLVPSRTDTRWWHAHVWDRETHQPQHGVEIRFLKGRLKFGGASAGAPFPSVVIVFRPTGEPR
jgi:site-specific DNA-methyltransferase (adenine-specific)